MRILLIAGGWSGEREVSLAGAAGLRTALSNLGHEVIDFDPSTEFDQLCDRAAECDFAFINLHGSPGEDGLVQALLESVNCPYQGADPRGSMLALDKAASKQVFRSHGLSTADWVYLPVPPEGYENGLELPLRYPLFVKPNIGGSSVCMSRVDTPDQLPAALKCVFDFGEKPLVEEAVISDDRCEAQEVTCAVLGDEALPPILIRPAEKSAFFDYHSKYTADAAEEICPAPIARDETSAIQEAALKAHRVLGLRGCSRADFILKDGIATLLEVNTLPGMTQTSLLPQAAAAAGYSFEELLARLIELGISDASNGDDTDNDD